MKKVLMILVLVVIAGAIFTAISRDWQPPIVALTDATYASHEVTASVSDNRGLSLVCSYLDGQVDGKSCSNADGATVYELTIDLSEFADGEHQVCVTAADANPYFPNRSSQCRSFIIDKDPPQAVLESATRYMQRGGAAAVFVSTPEPAEKIRLTVGGQQFKMISNAEGTRHFGVFAHPHDVEVGDFKPMVEIEDAAGNIRRLLINTVTKDRRFKTDTINVPHSFIESKSLEMLNKEGDGKDAFLEMNRTLRAESRAKIKSVILSNQSSQPAWKGDFLRNPGAPKASFAEYRTYLIDNEAIDNQTHFGLDIAGLAKMPIRAANDGKVIFADYLGIYGNCIIIDHGAYVSTLYAHMSQLEVTPGTNVVKGQVIGRSGNTGMAGGDHLHYAIYVSEVPVEPTEWFDPAWLQTRVDDIYNDFSAKQ